MMIKSIGHLFVTEIEITNLNSQIIYNHYKIVKMI